MFRNIEKEKSLIDREIALYKKEKLLAIDREIENYRASRQAEVDELGKQCSAQIGQYEHKFHYTKETRGVVLAKLEAKIEIYDLAVKAREEVVKADQNLIDSKNAEIKRLNEIITLLISKQPQHTTTIQQLK